MSELLDPVNARLNAELASHVFLPFDALVILQIPVCTQVIEDFWSCNYGKNGIISVRLATR